jgi:WhiB family redox-sensing transcriptional regulator
MSWKAEGACRGQDAAIFYDPHLLPRARLICRACTVRQVCLDDAVARGEPMGVWGGRTPGERHSGRLGVEETDREFVLVEIEHGATTVRQVVDRLGMSDVQVRRQVKLLEREGAVMVRRSWGSPMRLAPAVVT